MFTCLIGMGVTNMRPCSGLSCSSATITVGRFLPKATVQWSAELNICNASYMSMLLLEVPFPWISGKTILNNLLKCYDLIAIYKFQKHMSPK